MKILNPENPTRKTHLDKLYTCELSGWEIAAVTAVCNRFASGSGKNCLRQHCDSFSNEGDKLFPFLQDANLFEGDYLADDSKERLLKE